MSGATIIQFAPVARRRAEQANRQVQEAKLFDAADKLAHDAVVEVVCAGVAPAAASKEAQGILYAAIGILICEDHDADGAA
jgi:hypothetical protein